MSYCVKVKGNNFNIKESNLKPIAKLLKEKFPELKDSRTNLDAIMRNYDWRFRYNIEDDNVVGVIYDRENYHPEHLLIFDAMAPLVEPESWIEFRGEDGSRWRWIFDGKNAWEIRPEIVWENSSSKIQETKDFLHKALENYKINQPVAAVLAETVLTILETDSDE